MTSDPRDSWSYWDWWWFYQNVSNINEATKLASALLELNEIAPELVRDLEYAEETVNIQLGTPPHGWEASYNPYYNTITLNRNNSDLLSHGSILAMAHEARHAWQDIVARPLANTPFDKAKWEDTVYLEWDAYKFQADLDDKLGWGHYKGWWIFGSKQVFFQGLDLENSWGDYQKAKGRFTTNQWVTIAWWKIYNPYPNLTLNEDLYNNK